MDKKQQCELCSKEYFTYSNKCLKTEDFKTICLDCHELVFKELFKALYTLDEAKETIKFINEYNKTIREYLLLWRKYALYYNDTTAKLLTKLYAIEEQVSMTTFKKSRQVQCFHKTGHLELIKLIGIEQVYVPISDEQLKQIVIDIVNTKDYSNTLYISNIVYDKYSNIDYIV